MSGPPTPLVLRPADIRSNYDRRGHADPILPIGDNLLRNCAATVAALLIVACAYHNPDAPSSTSTATTISPTAPFSLSLGATVGMGADAGHATVNVRVQNVNGEALPGVTVLFTTDVGTLSETSVVTGPNGTATATLTAAETTAITATAGTLTARTLVTSQPAPPPPLPTPDPIPAPTPPVAGPLTVTLTASAALLNAPTIVQANVTNGTPSSFAWTFGDGTAFNGSGAAVAHTYGAIGTYDVGVTVTDTRGRTASASTTATVNGVPMTTTIPVTPSYTVTVTAAPSSVAVGETATLTAMAFPINGALAATGFAWDCDGDGTSDAPVSSNMKVCTYTSIGSTTSKVTVSGPSVPGVTGSTMVTVTTLPALFVMITASTVTPSLMTGGNVTFTATVTSTGPIPALVWQWDDTNDGSYEAAPVAGPNPNVHTTAYGSVGAKTVKVRAFDAVGGREITNTLTITVAP